MGLCLVMAAGISRGPEVEICTGAFFLRLPDRVPEEGTGFLIASHKPTGSTRSIHPAREHEIRGMSGG